MEAIYEINLKIAPLQLNTSQYLSRIEGSPPKKEPRLNPEGKMKKELGVRIYSGRDKINNGAFPILADVLLLQFHNLMICS